ncbi:MAG: PEP-CTERM sorting domain-containing protein [Microcoleaceae cyanobacterium]
MTANLLKKLSIATVNIAAISISLMGANPSQAVTFNINWQGNNGYSVQGSFSYDETQGYEIVTKNEFDSFDLSFFDAQSNLLASFEDLHINNYIFNAHFDTEALNFQEGESSRSNNGWYFNNIFYRNGRVEGNAWFHFYSHYGNINLTHFNNGTYYLTSTSGGSLEISKATSVPEPGTMAALGLVGLGDLLTQKKRYSIKG